MSYAMHHSLARGPAQHVLMWIADCVNADTGTGGPPGYSVDYIARHAGVGKATVIRQIEKLEQLGDGHGRELIVERGSRGRGNLSVYHMPRFRAWRDKSAGWSGADQRAAIGPERTNGDPVENPADLVRKGSEKVLDGGPYRRSLDLGSSSLGEGGTSPSGESGNGQGRQQSQRKQPRTPRPPDDPRVVARAKEITTRQGQEAAARYLRTVSERWGRHQAGVALAQHLGGQIGGMPE